MIRGERVTFLAQGDVDAGIDFSTMHDGAVKVSQDRRTVTITLPAPDLSDPRIDPDKPRVLSRKRVSVNERRKGELGNRRQVAGHRGQSCPVFHLAPKWGSCD